MALQLIDDWEKVVRLLAPSEVGLSDRISQERGSAGEKYGMKLMKKNGYEVASYNSWTMGDVWAIKKHTSYELTVTSIVLIQVKSSANDRFEFSAKDRDIFRRTVKSISNKFKYHNPSFGIPKLRANSRLIASGWLVEVESNFLNLKHRVNDAKCITSQCVWSEDDHDHKKELIKESILKLTSRIFNE